MPSVFIASIGAVGLWAQVASGGFHDGVGTPDSMRFTQELLGITSPNVLSIQVCKDDCIRGVLVEFTRMDEGFRYRVAMSITIRDQETRLQDVAGRCAEMADCVTQVRRGIADVVATAEPRR